MKTWVYLRHGYEGMLVNEMTALAKYFEVTYDLDGIGAGDQVMCRFSMMPFADMLQKEINARGATLVSDLADHKFIADMRLWYPLLCSFTAQTWFDEMPEGNGPFFVKGITNSIKDSFDDCVAKDAADLERVLDVHRRHPLLSGQPLVVRQLLPLNILASGVDGRPPVAEEYRFFVFEGQVISGGFYWSQQNQHVVKSAAEKGICLPDAASVDPLWLQAVIDLVADHARFFVVDVARLEDGSLTVIELNDATMSGLCGNDADTLYSHLSWLLHS